VNDSDAADYYFAGSSTTPSDAGSSGTPTQQIILELNALTGATNHNGGAIHFGPDGKLYIATGDNASGTNSQSLTTRLGKVLRISPDGSIPYDNPFASSTTGDNRAIWAVGLRNPYTFAFQPGTGRMFINDVGEVSWEEINDGIAGSNYGWPAAEGNTGTPPISPGTYRGPIYTYPHGTDMFEGRAITGGAFYNPAVSQFPAFLTGDYFFADFVNDWINVLDIASGNVTQFATGTPGTVDLRVSPDGSFYYLARNLGQVMQVRYTANIPVNSAPSFSKGPNISLLDAQSYGPSATTITFGGLTGAPDELFESPYTEAGFTVTPVSGRWLEVHDVHISGNPTPALWGDLFNATLDVTRAGGGSFAFAGLDMTSWGFGSPPTNIAYTIDGLLGGQKVFSTSGEIPPVETAGFTTLTSPSGALIDTLRFSLVRLDSQAYVLDNIKLLPAPTWATSITPGPASDAWQNVRFALTSDHPEFFSIPPAIDPYGHLTFEANPNVRGLATVTATLRDSGGTDNAGINTSSPQTFTIQIDKLQPWYNSVGALDVDDDKSISTLDALAIIDFLNSSQPNVVPQDAAVGQPFGFLDTDHDNNVSPIDALLVINALNAGLGGPIQMSAAADGEGEASLNMPMAGSLNASLAELIALLATHRADTDAPRRRGI
jgi:hypothetical protein